jgi:glutamate/tyrosine decarboxylase-like PLP-dependent enzyme
MLTRRRFLGYSSAGMLAIASSGCRSSLPNMEGSLDQENPLSFAYPSLAGRASQIKLRNYLLGYPINMNSPPAEFFTWRKLLFDAGIGTFAHNNVGNPFDKSAIRYNTHDFEREIINSFGKRFAFPAHDIWGFLSHSGTDSNMHGMYMGRTILKKRSGLIPKVYFTKEAHYSVQILGDLLGLEAVFVKTLPDGGMDANDLQQKLTKNRNNPALVVATIGTTFKGAIDRIELIQEALQGPTNYLHLDAALFGGYLPYTAYGETIHHQITNRPKAVRYNSIAVSCHKFFGFTSPAGLFITTESNFNEFNEEFSKIHNPEYIHHVPGTITCSRDAVKPAEFFFHTTPTAQTKHREDAHLILQNTTYLQDQLQSHFPNLKPIRANNLSNIIYFKKPSQAVVKKYSLATMQLDINGKRQDYAHAVVMPHVNQDILNELLMDLEQSSTTPV